MNIKEIGVGFFTRPTIDSLRELLDRLEREGWSADQQIQVIQLGNKPEAFVIQAVEEWLGSSEPPIRRY